MAYKLYPHQEKAVKQLSSGKILSGGVGSGKSLTALSFYIQEYNHLDLYVITTAKKRDSKDWQILIDELGLKGSVDSWNNIKKYIKKKDSFFIFDEQRVVGYSTWGKTFIKISKKNKWVLLTATPGDVWMDYIPVFIANGFYKHKTDFIDQHVEYSPYVNFPLVKKYHNEGKLLRHRHDLLIPMHMERHTTRHKQMIFSKYDEKKYRQIVKNRWNIFEDTPIKNASELLQCVRRVTATDPDRILNAKILIDIHDKVIIFYNYNYELEILKNISKELDREYYQWNGYKHEDIPDTDQWVYLVQYTAGAEGWNCTSTNVMIFYSLNYSFRMMEQAEGRIDRLNTPYDDLEYYTLTSMAKIDRDIYDTVVNKKKFNVSAWVKRSGVIF